MREVTKMGKTHSRRGRIRLFSFLAAVLLTLSAFAVSGAVRAARYERQLRVSGERALATLDDALRSMQADLQKGVYANTPPMLGDTATRLSLESAAAKNSLAALPLTDAQLSTTYKFLSQVGDFVLALSRKTEAGETVSSEERETMLTLLQFADTLTAQISALREQLYDGTLLLTEEAEQLDENARLLAALDANFEDAEQALTEYPTLLYDGPFSDHINALESDLLQNAAECSQAKAASRAAAFLELPEDALAFEGTEEDNTAAYVFSADGSTVAVTKRGGYLLYLLSDAFAGEAQLDYEAARELAAAFLARCGFSGMEATYYTTDDGICTINFAFADAGWICYPDLIKVSVSLADGAVLSADCRGYVMNHKTRAFPTPAVAREAAEQNLSPLLTVKDARLAVIPTDAGGETACYEFHCADSAGQECLVYIDASTGNEAEILLLLYSDNGVLTR